MILIHEILPESFFHCLGCYNHSSSRSVFRYRDFFHLVSITNCLVLLYLFQNNMADVKAKMEISEERTAKDIMEEITTKELTSNSHHQLADQFARIPTQKELTSNSHHQLAEQFATSPTQKELT